MDSTLLYNCALEFLGTLILVLLGDGVCACMGLNKSKGQGGGWIVITLGWGLAVMANRVGQYIFPREQASGSQSDGDGRIEGSTRGVGHEDTRHDGETPER